MQVHVLRQVLAPGVEHGRHPDLASQVLGIAPEGLERRGGVLEQQVVEESRASPDGGMERVRQRKDDVEILEREEFLSAGVDPSLLGQGLALGAVAIAAGVVDRTLGVAPVAPLEVSAERSRPARLDGVEDAALGEWDGGADRARVCADDVCELEPPCRLAPRDGGPRAPPLPGVDLGRTLEQIER